MSFRTVLAFAAAAVLSQAAAPSTLTEMVDRAQAAHAGKARIGVICEATMSHDQIAQLKALLPADSHIVVAHARQAEDTDKICTAFKRSRVDFAMVLPGTFTFAPGAPMSRRLSQELNRVGIPTVQ